MSVGETTPTTALQARIKELEYQLADAQAQLQRTDDLKTNQHILEGIIKNMPAVIHAKKLDGTLTIVNDHYAALVGEPADEIVGRNDAEFFPPERIHEWRALTQLVVQTRQPFVEEQHLVVRGEDRHFLNIQFPIADETDTVYATGSITMDITERKLQEEVMKNLQQEVIDAQQAALRELSTPIIPLMDGIIILPLIGSIDTSRARDIMRTLLAGITRHRARIVILDVTGVAMIDSGVAAHLNKTIQAARLKGAHTYMTGISDAIAETVVDLGIDWSDVKTLRDLQSGLIAAFEEIGITLNNAG
jgi:rsbT co-antagonist protein RsbR